MINIAFRQEAKNVQTTKVKCKTCNGTGTLGRWAVLGHGRLRDIQRVVLVGASRGSQAESRGGRDVHLAGERPGEIKNGLTTIEEVLRETGADLMEGVGAW